MSEDPALEVLRSLGLTHAEAKLYVALLKGSSDAKSLSRSSGVPYTKIHTVLSRLMARSLIVEKGGRPAIYEAKKVAQGLAEFKLQAEDDFESKLKEAEEALTRIAAAGETEKPDIWIIRSQEEILGKAYQTIGGAKNEVKLTLPVAPDWVISALLPVLKRLRAEEVSLKLLLARNLLEGELSKARDLAEIRVRDKMFGGGAIVDDKEALLFIGSEDLAISPAIWSNSAGLVRIARTYFDYLWESSGGFGM
jgi:sugar-specific transcriptional regulator TrmB